MAIETQLPGKYYFGNGLRARFSNALYDPKQTIWVRIDSEKLARKGTIGIAVPSGCDHNSRENWPKKLFSESSYGESAMEIFLEGKKQFKIDSYDHKVTWLEDYTGPEVFVMKTKAKAERFQPKDIMGHPIAAGQMVCFTPPSGRSASRQAFGIIESISDSGLTFEISEIDVEHATKKSRGGWSRQTIRLNSKTNSYDPKDDRCNQVTVIRADLLTELMTVRLTMR